MADPVFQSCPDSPNCVSSLESGSPHFVEPLTFRGGAEQVKSKLIEVINSFERAQVTEDSGVRIKAVFTSFLFRFKDDVEFYIDTRNKVVHIRSASRVGYHDLGANRRRCEKIRERFNR